MKLVLAIVTFAAVALAGCDRPTGSAPQGSEVGAAMPDTTQPRGPDTAMTAPDAGATGAVPADGSPPPVAKTPADQPATASATDAAPPTEAPK
jgi:hypothetical protein